MTVFVNARHQAAYMLAREQGIPRRGSNIYEAYWKGLAGMKPLGYVRGSLVYVWWAAGRDNARAKKLGAQDRATFDRLRLALPPWAAP